MRFRVRTMLRLAAQMYCGMCAKYTEITADLRCAECGL